MIDRLDVLSESDCAAIRSVVYELRSLWIPRNRQFPFFTLAAASYLDAPPPGSLSEYCRMAAMHNSILKDRLGWLYERLQQALDQHLKAPAAYTEPYALPGFHVFLAHEFFRKSVASIHCDLQYQLLDWSPADPADANHPLSFTLSIALPKSGAGLNIWDLDQNEIAGLSSWQLNSLIQTRRKVFVPYEVGSMILHSGHSVHQIAPMTATQPGEERITLQGHAVQRQGTWQIYW